MLELERIAGKHNTFAYADDLMIICEDEEMAKKIIEIIKKWSEENEVKLKKKKISDNVFG